MHKSSWMDDKDYERYLELRLQFPQWDQAGIYYITANDKIIYVGESVNLLKRLVSYEKGIKSDNQKKYKILRELKKLNYCVRFEVIEYVDEDKLRLIEGRHIRKYMPILNQQIPEEDGKHYKICQKHKMATLEDVINIIKEENK